MKIKKIISNQRNYSKKIELSSFLRLLRVNLVLRTCNSKELLLVFRVLLNTLMRCVVLVHGILDLGKWINLFLAHHWKKLLRTRLKSSPHRLRKLINLMNLLILSWVSLRHHLWVLVKNLLRLNFFRELRMMKLLVSYIFFKCCILIIILSLGRYCWRNAGSGEWDMDFSS